jgi:glycosyltransferase involved in cell wall biosynthesis
MTVDIITRNLNMADTLGRALESARKQTYPPQRIIVVDGCSSDDSYNVAKQFGVFWVIEQRRGKGRAWNAGVRYSTADCIVMLDADDWLGDTYLERCLEKMVEHVGIVASPMMWPNGRIEPVSPPFTVENFSEANLIFSASMFRKKVWEQVGGVEEWPHIWEDWDFWLRAVAAGWQVEAPEHLTDEMMAVYTANVRLNALHHL